MKRNIILIASMVAGFMVGCLINGDNNNSANVVPMPSPTVSVTPTPMSDEWCDPSAARNSNANTHKH